MQHAPFVSSPDKSSPAPENGSSSVISTPQIFPPFTLDEPEQRSGWVSLQLNKFCAVNVAGLPLTVTQ